jgi:hypothetical protein
MQRITPFGLVFTPIAEERFSPIRAALAAAGRDPRDRDAFLMEREVVVLLRELRPENGLGEGIDQLAALLHHAYLFWDAGQPTFPVTSEMSSELLGAAPPEPSEPGDLPVAFYAQLPERRVWAELLEATPPEPLDGCFISQGVENDIRVLGIFGLRPERMGFGVVEAGGPRESALARPDGSPLFAPTLSGGAAAGLHSLVGGEELLELGWRIRALAAASLTGAGRWTR